MTTPTANPVPSTDPNDLLFNAEKLDEVATGAALTYTDRLGNVRLTVAGVMERLGTEGAALLSRGVFSSPDKALSKGVASVALTAGGSGGTDGTFDLAFSGGAGSGAAGRFVVSGGAVVEVIITATGDSYTSAPTVSFAASSGLTGATAAAVIANNTDSGEFFIVQSGDDLILYMNDAGSASPRVRYMPVQVDASLESLAVFKDALGYVYGYVDYDGEMHLAGDDTSVQQHTREAKQTAYEARGFAVGFAAETNTSTSAQALARAESQRLDGGNLLAASYNSSAVMRLGDASLEMREPTLVQIARNQLLLFYCENYYDYSRGVGDIDGARILVRDITFDESTKKITQSTDREIANNRAFVGISPFPRAACTHYTVGRIRTGDNVDRVFLIYATNKSAPNNNGTAMLPQYRYSDDGGQTWSAEAALTIASAASANIFSGLTKMIQLKYGSHKGRIVSPHYIEPSTGVTSVVSVYSDDDGATWTMGTPATAAGNEFYIAEDVDGTIYGVARKTAVAGADSALYYSSSDGGLTWSLVTSSFPGYGNGMSSIVQCAEEAGGAPKMLRVFLDDSANAKATIALSYDAFTTVAGEKQLQPLFSKYNGLNMINDQDWMVAVEAFTPAATGRGIMLYWGNLSYVRS